MLSFVSRILSTALLLTLAGTPWASAQNLVEVVVGENALSTLESLVIAADLVDTLSSPGPFTVFAPTDTAFNDLAAVAPDLVTALASDPSWKLHLTDVLLFHVLAGSEIPSGDIPLDATTVVPAANGQDLTIVNNADGSLITVAPAAGGAATVVIPDVTATNGVAHVIDAVLLPSFVSTSIVDVAVNAAPEFSTLVQLVVAAGLAEDLSTIFGLTVFAPVNDAFAKLHPNVVAYLTSPEGTQDLANVLAYHVVEGVIPSTDAIGLWGARVPSLLGDDLIVRGYPRQGVVRINRATVVVADVLANNGIIHAIDSVLIPPYLRAAVAALSKGTKKSRKYYSSKGGKSSMKTEKSKKNKSSSRSKMWKTKRSGMMMMSKSKKSVFYH
eukprot:scaffold482_cov266-Amphora_coffeaeformis.AAC.53